MRYSQYYNKKIGVCGHLWQGRFYSCIMDEKHLMVGVKYVERNPVRAKIVKEPWLWRWSSAAYHCGERNIRGIIELADLFEIIEMDLSQWIKYVTEQDIIKEAEDLRKHTLTGRPLGEDNFIRKMEGKFGRRLKALPHGRPKNKE